jgi:hypothetical protein
MPGENPLTDALKRKFDEILTRRAEDAEEEPPRRTRPTRPPPDTLKRELQDVLSGPEYERHRQRESLGQRIKDALGAIGRRIKEALRRATSGLQLPGLPPWLAIPGWEWLQWLVLGVVLALILAVVVSRIFSPTHGAGVEPEAEPQAGGVRLPARDPEELLAEAARLARGGEFRRALRLVYLSALIRLHRAGLLPRQEARTNWEYLRAVRNLPAVHDPLSHLTAIVDRTWYGHKDAVADDYARCEGFADDLRRSIAEGP